MTSHPLGKELRHLDSPLQNLLLGTIPLGITMVDQEGRLLFINKHMEELIGAAPLGETCWSAYKADGKQCAECPLRRPIQIGVTDTMDTHGVLGGRIFRISHTGMMVKGKKVLLEVFHDVTEFRQAQQQVQQMEQHEALERERSRIARDMHDELGATLTHIKLLGELLEVGADRPLEVRSHAQMVSAKARQLADAMDEIVWAADPEKDHLENLAFYLDRYTEQFLELTNLRLRLDIPEVLPDLPLPAPVRHRVFVAVKEALNNTVKHARATQVWLRLDVEENHLLIEIKDDGCGFSPTTAAHAGNGLANLRRGLAEIGGTCTIDSAPGKGTLVRMTVGVPPADSPV